MRRAVARLQFAAALCLLVPAAARAAETSSEIRSAPQTTQLVLKLASEDLISVKTEFQEDPPTILVQFPSHRVMGTLPEESVIGQGAIQSLQTVYTPAKGPTGPRWIQELRIRLRGPYGYEVRAERGTITVAVAHPADVAGETVEVGLGGMILSSVPPPQTFSERFRAMEDALQRAMPSSWSGEAPSASPSDAATATYAADDEPGASPPPPAAGADASTSSSAAPVWGWALAVAAALAAAGAWQRARPAGWWRGLAPKIPWWPQRRMAPPAADRIAPEVRIVDQLVWRAFERKGFQLLQMLELEAPVGLMRLMAKEGRKTALLCVGDGLFFEKTIVDEFRKAMRGASIEEGFIVAPGSFTVPAQRLAKEHGIALIGREQLIELLSEGAVSEQFSKQLRQLHDQVQHAKITLEEYARQLETLRRQRNEATWFLGEERTKSASLQAQVDELSRQVADWQAQAKQWQDTAEQTRKQWEESQWYLGEARAAITHLEGQMTSLQDAYAALEARQQELTTRLQQTERERNEAQWFLGESRSACDMLQQETQRLAEQLRATQDSLVETKRMVEHYRRLAEGQERRRALRLRHGGLHVQVQGGDGAVLFEGVPRDLSATGLGLATANRLPDASEPLQIRLTLPTDQAPFQLKSRTVWQHAEDGTSTQASGHAFAELAAEHGDRLQRAIAQLAAQG